MPIRPATGTPLALTGLQEVALRHRHPRSLPPDAFRLLFDLHPDPLWIYDTEARSVLAANEACAKFYGRSPTELLALPLADLVPGEDPKQSRAPRKKERTPATVVSSGLFDFRGRRARLAWIRDGGRSEDGDPRKRLLAPQQAAEPETRSRAQDELLELLSHELRSPLGTIQLWTQLLRVGGHDPADADRALAMIERGVRSLEQIVDDTLDLSRIAAGSLTLDARPTDLAALVASVVDQARPTAEEKGVELQYSGPGPLPLIQADGPRLLRGLGKLLGDALKLTPRGGRVELRLEQRGREARIVVLHTGLDSGPRSEPGSLQGPSARSRPRSQRALELGLEVARTVVGLHGGCMEATSASPTEGRTLTIVLPLRTLAQPNGRAPTPAAGRLFGTRVLLVEDSDDAREALQIMLERWGADVATAASVEEALERVRSFRPHVLLSDLAMPGEDGYSLIRRVRALEAGAGGQTPAAALTAFTTPDDRRRALQAGYQSHLSKPVDPGELFAIVVALAGERSL